MISDLNAQISNFIDTNSADYYYGIALVSQVCRNKTLVATLRRKESVINTSKLIYELNKHLNSINYVKEEEATTEQCEENQNFNSKSQNSEHGAVIEDQSELSKEAISEKRSNFDLKRSFSDRASINNTLFLRVKHIELERNKLYGLRDSFHGQLHGKTTKKERYDLAKSIITLGPQIDKLNSKLKSIYKDGKLHEDDVKASLSVKEYKKLELAKKYVSRYKNKASKALTIEQKQHFEQKTDFYQLQINKILENE